MNSGQSLFSGRLGVILIVALALRLLAVFFSQGYMAHDDHFETVGIAWSWHQDGIFESDGSLRWEGKPEGGVMRSAAYNLFLLLLMKISAVFGLVYLADHMYFDRFVHALLSLLPVIYGYRYLRETTDEATATAGGLALAAHFLMPYLGVRDLVEMIAANLLLPSFYYAHRANENDNRRDAVIAGVVAGLAFAVRPHVAVALAVVPVAMYVSKRRLRAPLTLTAAISGMLILLGLLDAWTHGAMFASTINYIVGNLATGPAVPGPWYRYLLLLLGVLIPPLSIIMLSLLLRREVIRKHMILWSAAIAFVLVHSLITNKQERFILPVFPVLIVLGSAGIRQIIQAEGWLSRHRWIISSCIAIAVAVNAVALIPFSFNYGRRGLVEPLVWLSQRTDADRVIFDITERQYHIPFDYWRHDRSGAIVLRQDGDLDSLLANNFLVRENLPRYIMIMSDQKIAARLSEYNSTLGAFDVVFRGQSGIIDWLAHFFNPKYNRSNDSWVLRLK